MIRLSFLFFVFFLCSKAKSQDNYTWDDFVLYITQEDEELGDNEDWANRLEELELIHLHPIDINNATKEDLRKLPFLDDQQVNDIRDYVSRYNGMKTLLELRLIPSLTFYIAQWLKLFVYIAPIEEPYKSEPSLMDKMKNEMSTRIDIPFYHRRGFLIKNGYQGSRIYNQTRYVLTSSHISAGLRMERDAGERGIDNHGGYAMLHNVGCLNNLIIGDYKLGFGEGLVINQGFNIGKSSVTTRPSQGIRSMNSTDESHFMRGAAASVQLPANLSITGFASFRKGDATLDEDGNIKTLVTGGYHRTELETAKRNNYKVTLFGGNLQWQNKAWHAGITGYYQYYDKPLNPGKESYRAIYPKGSDFGVVGLNYGYKAYLWSLRGETAFSTEKQGIATLHTLGIRTSQRWKFSLSQRYFQKTFYSTYASALSENSNVQNETGATLHIDAQPIGSLNLIAYADFFYNTFPRYGLKQSSNGWEGMLMLSQNLTAHHCLSARYSVKSKMQTEGRDIHHRIRLQWIATKGTDWRFQTTALIHTAGKSSGYAISETLRYGLSTKQPFRASLSVAYFHTDDYNSRVYAYEPNVSSSTTTASFYGHGARISGTLQYLFWKKICLLELKYGITCYFDRDTQGSGMQTIYSKNKNDLTIRLKVTI